MINIRFRLLFTCLSLLVGCAIVGASLIRAADTLTSQTNALHHDDLLHFTIQDQIIPGHLLYPVRAATEKLSVLLASSDQKPAQQLSVARERLVDSQSLIDTKQWALATQTLIKGQQYLTECVALNSTHSYQEIVTLLQEYSHTVTSHKDQFSDQQKALLDQLLAENELIVQKISDK